MSVPTAQWWHGLASPGTHQATVAKQTQLTEAWLSGQTVNWEQEQRRAPKALRGWNNTNTSYSTARKLWGRNQLKNQV